MNLKKSKRIARHARTDALNALQELVLRFLSKGELDEFSQELKKILEYEMDQAADERLQKWSIKPSSGRQQYPSAIS
jgi:hypothetical protein